jgi:S1-C subfamily serine protease
MTTSIWKVLLAAAPVIGTATSCGDLRQRPAAVPFLNGGYTLSPSQPLTEGGVVSDVYERVSPAVVNVTVSTVSATRFFSYVQQGTGSGFVIDPEGRILTNYHVVKGASQLEVTLWDGTKATASVVGSDPGNDLAVIKVNLPGEKLTVGQLGDSDALRVGEDGLALNSVEDLDNYLDTRRVGDEVRLDILRGEQQFGVEVKLAVWPEAPASPEEGEQPWPGSW